jgi:hypothetical protein
MKEKNNLDEVAPQTSAMSKSQESVRYFPAPSYNLDDATITNRLLTYGFGRLYADALWESCPSASTVLPILKQEFFTAVDHVPRGLLIMGNIGVGKTSLLALIARYLVKQWNCCPRYISTSELFNLYFEREYELVNSLMKAQILFLDDIGRSYTADFPVSKFETFIEYRYAHLLPTFISSDMKLEDLRAKQGYERIADRLNDKKWLIHLELAGRSRRVR